MAFTQTSFSSSNKVQREPNTRFQQDFYTALEAEAVEVADPDAVPTRVW